MQMAHQVVVALFLPKAVSRQGTASHTVKRLGFWAGFAQLTLFVRKETKRKAARLLEDQDAGKDLSGLVEELLPKWVPKRSNA